MNRVGARAAARLRSAASVDEVPLKMLKMLPLRSVVAAGSEGDGSSGTCCLEDGADAMRWMPKVACLRESVSRRGAGPQARCLKRLGCLGAEGDNGAVGALTLRDIELATLMWASLRECERLPGAVCRWWWPWQRGR